MGHGQNFEKQASVFNQQRNCVSYLLLCNKLHQNLAALNQGYVLPHSACGWGIREGLSWVALLRVSPEVGVKLLACSAILWGSRIHSKEASSALQALIPCPLSLSRNCPQDMAAGFPQWVIQDGEKARDGRPTVLWIWHTVNSAIFCWLHTPALVQHILLFSWNYGHKMLPQF